MKRGLLNVLTALSLLLCVATTTLWVRSCSVLDAVDAGWVNDPPTSGTYVQAFSSRGAIFVRRFDVAVRGAAPPDYRVDEGIRLRVGTRLRWITHDAEPWRLGRYRYGMGFSAHDGTFTRRPRPDVTQVERDRGATFPHWVPIIMTALPPAWWLWRFRVARARRQRRLCPSCGYDLRASPERCPECGSMAPPQPPFAAPLPDARRATDSRTPGPIQDPSVRH